MTVIKYKEKPVFRVTGVAGDNKGHLVCVAVTPSMVLFRLKSCREVFELPITSALQRAMMLKADATKPVRHIHTVRRGI